MGVRDRVRPSLRYRHRVDNAPYGIQALDWFEYDRPVRGPLRLVSYKNNSAHNDPPYSKVVSADDNLVADCFVFWGEMEAAEEWLLNFATLVADTVEGGE